MQQLSSRNHGSIISIAITHVFNGRISVCLVSIDYDSIIISVYYSFPKVQKTNILHLYSQSIQNRGVVKLIIQMESAIANEDPQNGHANHQHHRRKHKGKHKKDANREPPNIQRWIARRCKRDILFLLASISGVKMKIYSLPTTSTSSGGYSPSSSKSKQYRASICKERVCRVSMDGRYLSMGEDCIHLDKNLEVSLGLDMCYKNVCVMLKQLGLYHYYTQSALSTYDLSTSGSSSSSTSSAYSTASSSSTITEDILRNGRLHHNFSGSGKLKPKHCITIHDPNTQRTLVLELPNCRDRTMWAKGLCGLKHLNDKARNFRWTVVACLVTIFYILFLSPFFRKNNFYFFRFLVFSEI